MPWRADLADGRALNVRLRPGAAQDRIADLDEAGALRVDVKARPEKGRANAALERLLSKAAGFRVVVVSGKTSRRKVVRRSS